MAGCLVFVVTVGPAATGGTRKDIAPVTKTNDKRKRRLGRPPATVSVGTQQRILTAARQSFATYGYATTTIKDIADLAGITTGAIYHYFDSKQELLLAVAQEAQAVVLGEFEQATANETTFVGKIRALLDIASRMHREDSSLARFNASLATDVQRHPELLSSVGSPMLTSIRTFFRALVRDGKRRGEIARDVDEEGVVDMLLALTMGLVHFGALTEGPDVLAGAIRAMERLFDGTLIRPATLATASASKR